MTLFINYNNLKVDEGLFNIIKQVSGIEWFDYAIFNASNDAFMIRLTNNTFEHSYKVVKYNNGLKIIITLFGLKSESMIGGSE